MILGDLDCLRRGTKAAVNTVGPNTFVSNSARRSLRNGHWPSYVSLQIPALLMRTSRRPYSCSMCCTAALMEASSSASSWTKEAVLFGFRCWICWSAASPFAILRDPTRTWLEGETEARSAAVSKPIPPLAPVDLSIGFVEGWRAPKYL
jgi:hypothetical protein